MRTFDFLHIQPFATQSSRVLDKAKSILCPSVMMNEDYEPSVISKVIGEDAKRFLKNRRRNSGASRNVQLKLIRLRGSFLASKGPSIVSATSSSLVVVSISTLPSLLQSKMQVEQQ